MGSPFSLPPYPALALPNEKNITAVRWSKPPKPCFNFYGLKSRKTKVKFVSEILLSVALFCMTQPGSASLSWIIAFLETRGQLWYKERQKCGEPESWGLMKYNVSGTSASQRATTLSHPETRGCRESTLLTLPEESEPPISSTFCFWDLLSLSSFSKMALPFSAACIPWMGVGAEGRDPNERSGRGWHECAPPPSGR